MLKITKFGMVCNIVSDICIFLGMAERESNTHDEAMKNPYYYRACGLRDNLYGLGISCEFVSNYVGDRNYYIGVSIKDNTKGAPAFAPCARYVFVHPHIDTYSHYISWCDHNKFDSDVINIELKKIHGCK